MDVICTLTYNKYDADAEDGNINIFGDMLEKYRYEPKLIETEYNILNLIWTMNIYELFLLSSFFERSNISKVTLTLEFIKP